MSLVLLAVLNVLVAVTVVTGAKVKKASKNGVRQNGHRTEMFIRDRIVAHKRYYRLKRRFIRLVGSLFVVACLLFSSLCTDISIHINLTVKDEVVADASEEVEIVETEEVTMDASTQARQTVDNWVDRWMNTNNYNETALTYASDVARSDREDTVTQELSYGWTRVSAIGFDYVVVREYKTINCEVVYINYVLPLNDWLELNMEDMELPFVHYYESSKYDYVKNCFCNEIEDEHTHGYSEINHIVSTRKEVR